MASRRPQDLYFETRAKWDRMRKICRAAGVNVFLTQTLRSPEEQQAMWRRGRETPGDIITNAQAWQSWHQPWLNGKSLAFDVAFRPEGDPTGATWEGPWEFVGAVGEFVGLRWGGRWRTPDRPHFEDSSGRVIADMRRDNGKEIGVTA